MNIADLALVPPRWRIVTLPNGGAITIASYLEAWRKLKAMPPQAEVANWEWYPVSAATILERFSYGVQDRINLRAGLRMDYRDNSARTSERIAATVKCECRWCGQPLREYRQQHARFCDASCRAAFY